MLRVQIINHFSTTLMEVFLVYWTNCLCWMREWPSLLEKRRREKKRLRDNNPGTFSICLVNFGGFNFDLFYVNTVFDFFFIPRIIFFILCVNCSSVIHYCQIFLIISIFPHWNKLICCCFYCYKISKDFRTFSNSALISKYLSHTPMHMWPDCTKSQISLYRTICILQKKLEAQNKNKSWKNN